VRLIRLFMMSPVMCAEVSLSPLIRWPNSLCHYNYPIEDLVMEFFLG
jgi:hypothetical protein